MIFFKPKPLATTNKGIDVHINLLTVKDSGKSAGNDSAHAARSDASAWKYGVAVDVETTGLSLKLDRILEIALIVFDLDSGDVVSTFETLVNPLRNVPQTSTEKHGLVASDLSLAPSFKEIGPWIANILQGKLVVAHNAVFDVGMLNAEFQRSDIQFRIDHYFCTRKMSGGKNLENSALDSGVDFETEFHHGALYDAEICRRIFMRTTSRALKVIGNAQQSQDILHLDSKMPALVSRSQIERSDARKRKTGMLFLRVDLYHDNAPEAAYLWCLSDALSDLKISDEEFTQLQSVAETLGISPVEQVELHTNFVRSLEKAALRDGLVTDSEFRILSSIATNLGVALELSTDNPAPTIPELGSLICVTGTTTIDGINWNKAKIEGFINSAGFVFTDAISKSVVLLLQESEGSQSGKVEKARRWGIPRMTIDKFVEVIGK